MLHPPNEPEVVDSRPWSAPLDLLGQRRELRSLKAQPQERKAKVKELRREQHSELQDLRYWWLARMIETRAPLREKMTLFWHGHFATSAQRSSMPTPCGGRTRPYASTRSGISPRS
ncbi:MAG: DUF1800 family protein [Chthoniobacterales bacterium]|nr:DUF1800 family protein [Chthoniobacterales bacterium]